MAIGYGIACPKPERHRDVLNARRAKEKVTRGDVIRAVYKRDGYACRCCGSKASLHPHEIRNRSLGGDPLRTSDTVTLCRTCHLDRGVHVVVGGKHLEIIGDDANKRLGFRYLRGEHQGRIFYSEPVNPIRRELR